MATNLGTGARTCHRSWRAAYRATEGGTMPMDLVDHLARHAAGTGRWEAIGEQQAICRHGGDVRAYVLRVGSSWGWSVAVGGRIILGEIDWDMTPEMAARAAFDAIEAADASRD